MTLPPLNPQEELQAQTERLARMADGMLAQRQFTALIAQAVRRLEVRATYLTQLPVAQLFDVSKWQNLAQPDQRIPFHLFKEWGFTGVIIKATQGVSGVDPFFTVNWQDAVAADLAVGFYHYLKPQYSGTDQALHHLTTIQPAITATQGELLPSWNDVEEHGGLGKTALSNIVRDFNATVSVNFGVPGIYCSPGFWNTYLWPVPSDWVAQYFFWVAHWTSAAFPTLPNGVTPEQTRLWQYGISELHSWVPEIPGYDGTIDANRFFGTVEELRAWAGLIDDAPEDCDCETLQEQVNTLQELVVDLADIQSGQTDILTDVVARLNTVQEAWS